MSAAWRTSVSSQKRLTTTRCSSLPFRFYLAHLRANRRIAAAPIRAIEREKSRRIRQHLRAVRRVLCIGYRKATTRPSRESRFLERDVMAMRGSYRVKLEAIGFAPWSDPDELAAFESVNANLQLDEDTAAFARRYPILENVKRWSRCMHQRMLFLRTCVRRKELSLIRLTLCLASVATHTSSLHPHGSLARQDEELKTADCGGKGTRTPGSPKRGMIARAIGRQSAK